ncbi:MAG: ABC transporter ATP-binding protein, partial [Anaerolineae bacterium]|nr:ABC transporter ATP-binding protein [Anaerolineae bacterium]
MGAFRRRRQDREEFWALRNVSFEIQRGETVGLIGANGTGKSTVLKLISRIVEPTSGEIEVTGRVGALLELGAGFHPDLTGRENIYLNASIQGLSRDEVRSKFDEIVDFAELHRFIDVPVKHYSSGMYVRLGFSIAVYTEPDILLVDEVLSVGDASFQRKCLNRISSLREKGSTILFVSHDLESIRRLCSRGIWLQDGVVAASGPVEKVIDTYMSAIRREHVESLRQNSISKNAKRWGSGEIEIVEVELLDALGRPGMMFKTSESIVVRIHFVAHRRIEQPVFGIAIHRDDGMHISGPNTRSSGFDTAVVEGTGYVDYCVEALPLLEGAYELSATAYDTACLLA